MRHFQTNKTHLIQIRPKTISLFDFKMSLDDFNKDQKDIESSLLQQFSCMSTNNKDDLIREFQRLLAPNELNIERCIFFLELSNWNLQQAICSYFDYDAHKLLQQPLPQVSLCDVTVGEGEEVQPNTKFIKTWRVENSGTTIWPPGCFLAFVCGCRMGPLERVSVDSLKPGETADISVSMISPSEPGIYQGQWRMTTGTGQYFSDTIWCIITVAEGGLLSLTQQMSSLHSTIDGDNSTNHHSNNHLSNPFEANLRNNFPAQRFRDSEMQNDEDMNQST